MKNQVVFVGAGPGDPELITVKGKIALEEADLIIYAGSLVPEAVMKWAGDAAEKTNSASMHLEEIITLIKEYINSGKKVVRLHTGDPSLYGAITEQMVELEKNQIPYKVIPGVTAAFAASASMCFEYTLPEITQTLILTRMEGRTPVPEREALEKLADHKASMAIYLSIGLVDSVEKILKKAYGENTLCAVAFRVSQPEEKIFYTKIKDLASCVRTNNITHQALIIVSKNFDEVKNGIKYKSKLYDRNFTHEYRTGV